MKKSSSRWKPLVALFLTACLLAGCWDRVEINDVAFVMVSGFDREPQHKIRQELLIAMPGQMGGAGTSGGGGGTNGNQPFYSDSAVGDDVTDTLNILQSRMARYINFSHRRVLIIGEETARSGLSDLLDEQNRQPLKRRMSSYIVIAEGKAADLINSRPHLERFSGEAIREILTMSRRVNLKEVIEKLSHIGEDPVIPLFRPQKNEGGSPQKEPQFVGIGLFSDDKLVGKVKGEDMEYAFLLMNRYVRHAEKVEFRGHPVHILVEGARTSIRLENTAPPYRFRVDVEAHGEVSENFGLENLYKDDIVEKLEKAWSKTMKSRLEKVVSEMQKVKCDAISAGRIVARMRPKDWKSVMDRWHEEFARSTFDIHVKTRILRFGQTSTNSSKKTRVLDK